MADARAMTRVLDELLWTLRREGLAISTAQAIVAARVLAAVGFADKARARDALAAAIVTRRADVPRFRRAFEAYFAGGPRLDLWERLAAKGFTDDELAVVREAFTAWTTAGTGTPADEAAVALFARGSELEQLLRLAGVRKTAASVAGEMQLGFATHRALSAVGMQHARNRLNGLRVSLRDALGARGDAIADALAAELDAVEADVRDHLVRTIARREEERRPDPKRRDTKPFVNLDPVEVEEVRRAVRRFAERLRGGASVRRRRARRGHIDARVTLRRAMRTGGVPFRFAHRDNTRDKPRIVLLCDISDSVRSAAGFMLELVAATHDLFARTRSFVFVSEVAETTSLFERLPVATALAEAHAGAAAGALSNSNYGRALRAFERREAGRLDRRTTLVILGDGRANFQDDGADVVRRLRDKVKALYWLTPEPRSGWSMGDSAMGRYEPLCTRVLEVRTARELEEAARLLVRGA